MARRSNSPAKAVPSPVPRSVWIIMLAIMAVVAAAFMFSRPPKKTPSPAAPKTEGPKNGVTTNNLGSTEVNQALMVTVELDFNGPPPGIAEALREIERRHQPAIGTGRVFAILDAYGEPTPDGKKLHMSMHVSMERPGIGSLIFRRTGETLWSSRIVPTTNAPSPFAGTQLTVLFDDGTGKLLTVDGSKGATSILDASLKETGQLLRDAWPEGVESEMTFIYSACGCPVKVKCRRAGDRTMRTKDLPVIFPDDPAVVEVITRLMRW